MKSFGYKVQAARKQKGWTSKMFIERLGVDISPSYITKIEVHGEIPAPYLIGKIAEVLDLNQQELFELAREEKMRNYDRRYQEILEQKHQLHEDLCLLERLGGADRRFLKN